MSSLRFCPRCGKRTSSSDRFCVNCGNMISTETDEEVIIVECARCKGTGKRYVGYTGLWARNEEDICPACGGTGYQRL